MMPRNLAKLAGVVFVMAIGGCDTAGRPPPPIKTASVSFDGIYRGMISLTSASVGGGSSNWCDTPPAISLAVQNNVFSYILAHPNVPAGPSLSPSFTVTVASDGSFNSTSQNGGATMIGRITGTHMAGQIDGTACGYAFNADRR